MRRGQHFDLADPSAGANRVLVPRRDRAAWEALFRTKPTIVALSIRSGTWFDGVTGATIGAWTSDGTPVEESALPAETPDAN